MLLYYFVIIYLFVCYHQSYLFGISGFHDFSMPILWIFQVSIGEQENRVSYPTQHPDDHVTAVTADFQACIGDGTVLQIVRQHTLAATAALTLA